MQNLINGALKLKAGRVRKIHMLFAVGTVVYLRVNDHARDSGAIESYWIEMRNGVPIVTPEDNRPFKAEA
jgi:hypothetical protein